MSSILNKSLIAVGTICLLLAAQAGLAQTSPPTTPPATGPNTGPNFAEHQQKELAHIAQRIQILQTLQSCVQSATDHAAMKACNQTAKQAEQAAHH